jgi:phosphatidylglycerophosphatase A
VEKQRSPQDHFFLLLGQWFFTGRAPLAPGTVGSLGALPLVWALRATSPVLYLGVTVLVCVLGIFISQKCSEILDEKDPSSVVIDEVAGVLIALGMVRQAPLYILALAWILFRVFDITKPSLIDKAQYWPPNGLGIMADDIIAGLVAGVISWGAFQALLFHS